MTLSLDLPIGVVHKRNVTGRLLYFDFDRVLKIVLHGSLKKIYGLVRPALGRPNRKTIRMKERLFYPYAVLLPKYSFKSSIFRGKRIAHGPFETSWFVELDMDVESKTI